MLREFLFERGNEWERTMRQDLEQWTAKVWTDVYGFAPRKGEGWASWKDTYFVGKFRAEHDPKDGFYPVDCKNPRECRVIEFLSQSSTRRNPRGWALRWPTPSSGHCPEHGRSIGGDLSKNWWRNRSPTSARNLLLSPHTFSTSTSRMGASTRRRRLL